MPSIKIGAIEATVVSDGRLLLNPSMLLGDPPNAEWQAKVQLEGGRFACAVNCLLVRAGGKLILLDTGTGRDETEMLERWGGQCGFLVDNLRALGIAPAEIDTVILSHGHADHIGGATRKEGEVFTPTFPNATYWFWKGEWDYWTTPAMLEERPFLQRHLSPLEEYGRVELSEHEVEVAPGVRIISAPGHTPGHICIAMTSGQDMAVYAGDLVHHGAQCCHPDWSPAFDLLPEMSAASRRRVLDEAHRNNAMLLTAHLPSPGIATPTSTGWSLPS